MDHFALSAPEKLKSLLSDQAKPVMALDPDMRIVFANSRWLEASRRDWEAIGNRHYFDVFDIKRERISRLAMKMRRALSGHVTMIRIGEDGVPHARGRRSPVRWHAQQRPLCDRHGEVEAIVQILEPHEAATG